MKAPDANAKRILVVDDEPAICAVCRRVLTCEGFEVDIAVNGKVAQDMIEKKQYAIFLLDIKMPVMSGKEFYQWLQEQHPQLTKGLIFTSGSVICKDTLTFIEKTGRPFLPKPFTPDDLKAVVRETMIQLEK